MKQHVNTFNPSASSVCVCVCVCVCGRVCGGAEIKEACPVVLCGPWPLEGGRGIHQSTCRLAGWVKCIIEVESAGGGRGGFRRE